jgi:hypothetical protein
MERYEMHVIIFQSVRWREATWKTQAMMEVDFEIDFKLTAC